jgi:hypothetical protein
LYDAEQPVEIVLQGAFLILLEASKTSPALLQFKVLQAHDLARIDIVFERLPQCKTTQQIAVTSASGRSNDHEEMHFLKILNPNIEIQNKSKYQMLKYFKQND